MSIKIAAIQINSSSNMLDNIAKIEDFSASAVASGAHFVVTPENAFLMAGNEQNKIYYNQDEHPAVKASAEIAKRHKIWFLAGSIAVAAANDKNYNRSILFNPKGEIAAKYDKIHLFDVEVGDGQTYRESSRIVAGNEAIIVDTEFGKLGMSVCYDLRFPHLYRALAKAGAKMITIPAAFTQVTGEAHWHVLLRARAIETGCFIIAPAQTGTHAGNRQTYGHSLIINPWGKIIAEAGTEEGIIYADIDLSEVDKARSMLPSLQHDREFKLSSPQ